MAIPMIYGGSPDSVARADQVRAQMIAQRRGQSFDMLQQANAMLAQQAQQAAVMQDRAQELDWRKGFSQQQFESQESERRAAARQRAIENLQRDRQLDISQGQLERAERADTLRWEEAARIRAQEAQALRMWREEQARLDREDAKAKFKAEQDTEATRFKAEQDQRLFQSTIMRADEMPAVGLLKVADRISTPHIRTSLEAMASQKLKDDKQAYNQAKSWADQANQKLNPFLNKLAEAEVNAQEGGWFSTRKRNKLREQLQLEVKTALPPEAQYMVTWDGSKYAPNIPDPDAEIRQFLQDRERGQFGGTGMIPPGSIQPPPSVGYVPDVQQDIAPFGPVGASGPNQPQMIEPPDVDYSTMPYGPAGVGEMPVAPAPRAAPAMITPEDTSLIQPGRAPRDFTPYVGGEYRITPSGTGVQFPNAPFVPAVPLTEDPAAGGGGVVIEGQAFPYTASDQQLVYQVYKSLRDQGVGQDEALAIAFQRVNLRIKNAHLYQ